MKRTIFLIVLVVACVGYYRGWFRLTSDKGADKSNITLTVDKSKIQDDKQAADAKAHEIVKHP